MINNYRQFNESREDKLMNIYTQLTGQKIRSDIESLMQSYGGGDYWKIYTVVIDNTKLTIQMDLDYMNSTKTTYILSLNNKQVPSFDHTQKLYLMLRNMHKAYTTLRDHIISKVTVKKHIIHSPQLTKEVDERIEEFDVIRDGQLDMISLQSLFEFYELSFDEDKIGRYLKYGIRY